MRTILAQLLEPVEEAMTPDVARKMTAIRTSAEVQARIDELADTCNEGELTPAEAAEYDSYVDVIDLIAVLKAQARRVLEATTS